MNNNEYTVTEKEQGERLDTALSMLCDMTRSQAAKKIKAGFIHINGSICTKSATKVYTDDIIHIIEDTNAQVQEQNKQIYGDIHIIDETPEYLVVYKPAGLLVHPTMKHESVTLTDWLVTRYPKIKNVGEQKDRPGIVHRLDKEASGLLVIAKTQPSFEWLKTQFQKRQVKKIYTVLVHGDIAKDQDTIDFTIDRGMNGRMVARPKVDPLSINALSNTQPGKTAMTEFVVLKRFVNYSLLEVRIETGRTHQIRVHMFAYGHPVVGDPLYKQKRMMVKKDRELDRLFLHATTLSFTTMDGQTPTYHVDIPETLTTFLQTLTPQQLRS